MSQNPATTVPEMPMPDGPAPPVPRETDPNPDRPRPALPPVLAAPPADLAPGDRVGFWIEGLRRYCATFAPRRAPESDFQGEIRGRPHGSLLLGTVVVSPVDVERRPAEARDGHDELNVTVRLRGSGFTEMDGRQLRLGLGDLAVLDHGRPARMIVAQDVVDVSLNVPRTMLDDYGRAGASPAGQVFSSLTGFGAVLAHHMRQAALGPGSDPRATEALVAMLLRPGVETRERAAPHVRAVQRDMVRREAEARLADPGLTAEWAARRLGMSVARLDALFREEGTTFQDWLVRRRLERCRDLLARGGPNLVVAEVARRLGFESTPAFTLLFRTAFGTDPADIVRWDV